jgi:hypothetical protein
MVLQGYWLWFAWAIVALVVVVGYFRVRRHLDRVEKGAGAGADETPLRAERRREHEKDAHKHKGVE